MSSREPQWHCYYDRTQDGPLTHAALARRFGERAVPLHALVWSSDYWGDERWRPAREVPAFLRAATAPALPVTRAVPVPLAAARPPVGPTRPRPAAAAPTPSFLRRPAAAVPAYARRATPPVSSAQLAAAAAALSPAPGARFWARLFDTAVCGYLLMTIFVQPFFPGLARAGLFLNEVVALAVWTGAEILWLWFFGNTPGKWLFGLRLQMAAGGPLTLPAVARRTLDVYLRGLGAGIPVFFLFTLSSAYDRLQRDGATIWDQNAGLQMTRTDNGWLGWLLLCLAVLIFLSVATRS